MSIEQDIRAQFDGAASTLSPETAETFRQQMQARGLSAEQIDATLAKHRIGAPSQTPTETTPVTPKQYAPDIGPDGLPRLTAAQTAQAAETLRKFWTGDPSVLEQALKNAGAGAPVTEPAPDGRTDDEREFDASSLASPVDPSGYDLNGIHLGRDQGDSGELAKLDRTLRSTMSELSVAKSLGRSTAEAFMDSADTYAQVAEAGPLAVKQYHLEQSALFARVARIGWQEAAKQMAGWLQKMSPETKAFIASGAVESAVARVKLYQAFTLSQARAGMKGSKT